MFVLVHNFEPIGSKYTLLKKDCNKNIEPNGFLCYIHYMGRTKNFDRNEVLDSAIQVFWKKGYSDTSLSDLEKATGVNKSGLYSEFKDKDDIFHESLRRYHENNSTYDLLKAEPLGWNNIENLMKGRIMCKGLKGCFMAFTMREYNIIPVKIRQLLEDTSDEVFELFLNNLKAAKVKNPEVMTKTLLTFSTGMSLKSTMFKPEDLVKEVQAFLDLCKK